MKRNLLKKVFAVAVTGAAIIVVLFLIVRYSDSVPEADTNIQVSAILEDNSCLMCHTTDAKEPFYASMPIIGEQVVSDIQTGVRAFNMDGMIDAIVNDGRLSEVDVAKIENVTAKGRMPLEKFTALHWGSHVNSKEKDIILKWVADVRANNYATNSVAKQFANEPVQPIVEDLPVNPLKADLGNRLFHDTRLSDDNTLSCSSCHGLNTAGVDNKRFSEGVLGQFGDINAPTVYNAALNFIQFWDGRAADLSEQAGGPPVNPVEMGAHSWDDICAKLNNDKVLVAEFSSLYGEPVITQAMVTNAIAEFEKTLLTPDNRFDSYLKGDVTALNEQEKRGYDRFKYYDCHTCHVGQNLGGQSFEYMGHVNDYFAVRGDVAKADNGRFNVTAAECDKNKFKTPGLRNIALTAPYFHDGTVETVNEAVEKMMIFQTYHEVAGSDVDDIVAFLNTLTSEKLEQNK